MLAPGQGVRARLDANGDRLRPGEPAAPVAILSKAQRAAPLACRAAGALCKQRGRWLGLDAATPIAGVTVADLGREKLLTITIARCHGSASLTERGHWFARTLASMALEERYAD